MHARHRDEPTARRASQRGMALVLAFVSFTIAALLVAMAGALALRGTTDPAPPPIALAASQPSDAVGSAAGAARRVDASGVIDFRNDVVDDWSNRWGNTWRSAPQPSPASTAPRVTAATPSTTRIAATLDDVLDVQVRRSMLRALELRPVGYRDRNRVCPARRVPSSDS